MSALKKKDAIVTQDSPLVQLKREIIILWYENDHKALIDGLNKKFSGEKLKDYIKEARNRKDILVEGFQNDPADVVNSIFETIKNAYKSLFRFEVQARKKNQDFATVSYEELGLINSFLPRATEFKETLASWSRSQREAALALVASVANGDDEQITRFSDELETSHLLYVVKYLKELKSKNTKN